MIDLGLTPVELAAYERALLTSHRVQIEVTILDSDENEVASLATPGTPEFLEGGVVVDETTPVERSLSVKIVDERGLLDIDPESPADSSLWPSFFVSVVRRDEVTELDRWVDCPVFLGPLSDFKRNDTEVEIEAQGKESLALDPFTMWKSLTLRKGQKATAAIRTLMGAQGETKFSLMESNVRLKKRRTVMRGKEAWLIARSIARRNLNAQLFYDGMGRLRARRSPGNTVFTFIESDEGGHVLDDPSIDWDILNIRNAVIAEGQAPKGRKRGYTVRAVLEKKHPLSPQRMARNGTPRYMVENISVDSKKRSAVKRDAQLELSRLVGLATDAQFTSLPIAHLEPRDPVALVRANGDLTRFFLRKYTIPLDDEPMQVGILQRVSTRKRGQN